jgi:hypothetical protein
MEKHEPLAEVQSMVTNLRGSSIRLDGEPLSHRFTELQNAPLGKKVLICRVCRICHSDDSAGFDTKSQLQ